MNSRGVTRCSPIAVTTTSARFCDGDQDPGRARSLSWSIVVAHKLATLLSRRARRLPPSVATSPVAITVENQPEVLTYDEVLARAKWALLLAEKTSANL